MTKKQKRYVLIEEILDENTGKYIEKDRRDITESGYYPAGDDYIHLDGGIVQNDTMIPVFDTDVEDIDLDSTYDFEQLEDLIQQIKAHPHARDDLRNYVEKFEEMLNLHKKPEDHS